MSEPRERKNNRLVNYDYSQNGYYFVTVCTHNRKNLLGRIVGGDAYIAPQIVLSELGSIVKKHIEKINVVYKDIRVDKYVIMPNHLHFILAIEKGTMWASSPTKTGIPAIIRSLKIMVSKQIGYSIWQRSYHDHIIRNEAEYLKIWEYIDTNPLKWEDDIYCLTEDKEGDPD